VVVADDIFDSPNELLPGTDTAANDITATPTSRPTSANVDTGILNPDDAAANLMDISIAATCFNCVDGFVRGTDTTNPDNRCHVKCDKKDCCTFDDGGTPEDACSGFNGNVCLDGSCNGKEACQNANIPSVVNSCIGDYACYNAGGDGGSIGNVNYSCKGIGACFKLAHQNGKVGNVLNSCIGEYACQFAAFDGGLIGSITDSCKEGIQACSNLGFRYGIVGNILNACRGDYACEYGAFHGGSIANITRSCYGYRACDSLGESGDVGNINLSCTFRYSCYYGGAYGGIVGNIVSSCTADDACWDLGRGQGKVGHVTHSCSEYESCQDAGSNRGTIGSITQSCNAANACDGAGLRPSGGINSNLDNCCNADSACVDATQATLPTTCKAPAPTPPPTSKVRECIIYLQCLRYRQLSMSTL
jgi:hypothetical protein